MAMASEPTSPNGKIGGLEVKFDCELCESASPVKYCSECNAQLCASCSKAHGKLKATMDHPLLDIYLLNMGSLCQKSGNAESGPCHCAKHATQTLDCYCETCKEIICTDCGKHHKGHAIEPLKDNLKLYQAICTQHIKSLLDKTQDLEDHKVLLDGTFSRYDEAIQIVKQWEKELIQLVEECSLSLLQDLEKAKGELQEIASDDEKGFSKVVGDVEEKISKLHNIRKVSDADIFSHELAASQQLLEEVNHFMRNVLHKLTIKSVNDILPTISQLSSVKSGIKDLITSSGRTAPFTHETSKPLEYIQTKPDLQAKTADTLLPRVLIDELLNLKSVRFNSEIGIPNPESYNGYRINQSYFDDEYLMIHGSERHDIRLIHLENRTIARHISECKIWDITSTGPNEHVVSVFKNLYLLDSEFKIVNSEASTNEKYFMCAAYLSLNRLIMLQLRKSKENMAQFSFINIKDERFRVEKETNLYAAEEMKCIVVDKDRRYLFTCGDRHMYRINLQSWTSQHLDMSPWVRYAWSLCVSGENILVGDGNGDIHVFDMKLKHVKILLRVATAVKDLAVVNGYLVVTTTNNKVLLYK